MMKKYILTMLVVACTVISMQAQDKYEYASVVYTQKLGGIKVFISKEGSFEQVNVQVKEGAIFENLSPVIETINKMSREGWEVYQNNVTTTGVVAIYYYLRKKKE